MEKNDFKFELGQKVHLLGLFGTSFIIYSRGFFENINGTIEEIYFLKNGDSIRIVEHYLIEKTK